MLEIRDSPVYGLNLQWDGSTGKECGASLFFAKEVQSFNKVSNCCLLGINPSSRVKTLRYSFS